MCTCYIISTATPDLDTDTTFRQRISLSYSEIITIITIIISPDYWLSIVRSLEHLASPPTVSMRHPIALVNARSGTIFGAPVAVSFQCR